MPLKINVSLQLCPYFNNSFPQGPLLDSILTWFVLSYSVLKYFYRARCQSLFSLFLEVHKYKCCLPCLHFCNIIIKPDIQYGYGDHRNYLLRWLFLVWLYTVHFKTENNDCNSECGSWFNIRLQPSKIKVGGYFAQHFKYKISTVFFVTTLLLQLNRETHRRNFTLKNTIWWIVEDIHLVWLTQTDEASH